MNSFLWGGGDPGLQRLGWVLVHFLWQGIGIGAALGFSLWLARRSAPTVRYLLLCAGLGVCLLAPLATWELIGNSPARSFHLETGAPPTAQKVEKAASSMPPAAPALPQASSWNPWRDQIVPTIQSYLPFLVALWLTGIVFLLLRHAVGWFRVRRIVRSGLPIEDKVWIERLDRLRIRMKALPPVRLLQSAWIEVPVLIGWLRPTLLIPASLLTGLPVAQVEAIFAHELAHIVRHDFLVNLLQVAIETLLFYHPVVWWIGRELRQAREECCDDLAIEALGGYCEYVVALASLEELRADAPAGVLSAGGGSLLRRLRRLVAPAKQETGRGRVAGLLVVLGLTGIVFFAAWAALQRAHEGPTLRGVVVDLVGHPVPGAEVSFCQMDSLPNAKYSASHAGEDYKKIAYTDSRGRFVLPDLSPAILFTVVATAPGRGPDFAVRVDPAAGKIRFVLPKLPEGAQGAEARGHVVGPDGQPVAGAQIRPHGYTAQSTWRSYGQGEGWPIKATDANGDFALPQTWFDTGMNQGVDGQITATGFAPFLFSFLPYNGQPHRIVLDHGGTVIGRLVYAGGHGLPGVEVAAIPTSNSGVYEVSVTTDAGGRFAFPNLMANEAYRIYGKRSSLSLWGATRAQGVRVGASGSTTDMGDLQIMFGRAITGRIVSFDHTPIRGSEIQLIWKDRDGGSYLDRFHPGTDGKFAFPALDGEKLQIRGHAPGYRYHLPSQRDGVALTVAPDLAEVEIVCEPETPIVEGQVVLTDGKPLSRPMIVTRCRVGGDRVGYPVGLDGKFSFSAADGDRFTFDAVIPGYQPALPKPRANKEDEVVVGPSTQVTLTFEPTPKPAPQPPQ